MIEHLEGEIEYLREQLATTIQQAAKERERADVLQREALYRLEALTAGPVDRQDGTHEAVASPESAASPEHGSTVEGDADRGSESVWDRIRKWFR